MHVEPATGEQYCNAAQASKSSQAVHERTHAGVANPATAM
jgi:hypothetical protein